MRGLNRWLLAAPLLLLGCAKETPTALRDPQLGIAAMFPGAPTNNRYVEQTPFGSIEWFCRAHRPGVGMDRNYQVDVGNLPPGTQGGNTPDAVLETYHRWLLGRFGKVDWEALPPARGEGYAYHAQAPSGAHLRGLVVVLRGRLHRAEATTPKADDSAAKAFLDSFEVLP